MKKTAWAYLMLTCLTATLFVSSCSQEPEDDYQISLDVTEATLEDYTAALEDAGLPPDLPGPESGTSRAAVVAKDEIQLVLFGSSSCPANPIVSGAGMDLPDRVITSLHLESSMGDGPCTDDYSPSFYTVSANDGLTFSPDIDITLDYPVMSATTESVLVVNSDR